MATIIKHDQIHAPSGTALRGVAYDLTDMALQADDYLSQVRREAAKIVEQARREAAAVRSQAEAAGKKAAEDAIDRILDEKVARQMQSLAPALKAAVGQIQDAKQDWRRHWEESGVTLAVAIAGRLVRGELSRRPEIPLAWIREALELSAGSGEITVLFHPDDCEALRTQTQQLAAMFNPLGKARVVADAAIAPGGCKIVTEFGGVDMQIEAQLERIAAELAG